MFVVAVWVVNLSRLQANLKGDIMRDLTLGLILAGILLGAMIIALADPPESCASPYCYGSCYSNINCIGKCWCAKSSKYDVEGICVPMPGE